MYVRSMAEKKQFPKWFLAVWILLAVWGLVYILTEEGWRRWLGVVMLVSSIGAAVSSILQRKKDSST